MAACAGLLAGCTVTAWCGGTGCLWQRTLLLVHAVAAVLVVKVVIGRAVLLAGSVCSIPHGGLILRY